MIEIGSCCYCMARLFYSDTIALLELKKYFTYSIDIYSHHSFYWADTT